MYVKIGYISLIFWFSDERSDTSEWMLVRVRQHQIISKQFMFKGMSNGDHEKEWIMGNLI